MLARAAPLLRAEPCPIGSGGQEAAESPDEGDAALVALLARAESLELDTDYTPPPGDPLHHHTSGFAKILCSGVFLTGLDPADAAANVGGFTSPFDERANVVDTVVDFDRREVRLTLADGVTRAAKVYGSQGCVTRPIGEDSVFFTPSIVEPNLPPANTTPWPMGDVLSDDPYPAELDMELVDEAVETAMGPAEALTQAFVVTYKGRIIGEGYGEGTDMHTPLGQARKPVPPGRRLDGGADPARGILGVRTDVGAGVAGGWSASVRRGLPLGERQWQLARTRRGHVLRRGRRSVHHHDPQPRPRGGALG